MTGRVERLAGLPDEYVECRALGHDDEVELGYGVHDDRGRLQVNWSYVRARCRRCTRTVERHYDQTYLPLRSQPAPKYPKGYVLDGAGVGPWRVEARRELFTRRVGPPPRRRRQA